MPIGYTPTAKGNVGLTFPFVADEHRTLGRANIDVPVYLVQNVMGGSDKYGWGKDANRMAMAKVQATRSAQRMFDRTPRFRIEPSGNTASQPLFQNKDESNSSLRKMLSMSGGALSGGGSDGALSTPAGRKYRATLLPNRLEQIKNQLQSLDEAPHPLASHERALPEKEAEKVQADLEINSLTDELLEGDLERGVQRDLGKWINNMLQLLPYYGREDTQRLTSYVNLLTNVLVAVLPSDKDDNISKEAHERVIAKSLIGFLDIVRQYMSVINRPLSERIVIMRSILKQHGMERLAKGIRPPTQQEEANAVERAENANNEIGDFSNHMDNLYEPLLPEEGEEIPVPESERGLPEYRTQAQITAEINRRFDESRIPKDRSMFDIAHEWSQWTNYRPRAGTPVSSIKRTLVEKIKRILPADDRVEGMGRRRRHRKISVADLFRH